MGGVNNEDMWVVCCCRSRPSRPCCSQSFRCSRARAEVLRQQRSRGWHVGTTALSHVDRDRSAREARAPTLAIRRGGVYSRTPVRIRAELRTDMIPLMCCRPSALERPSATHCSSWRVVFQEDYLSLARPDSEMWVARAYLPAISKRDSYSGLHTSTRMRSFASVGPEQAVRL